MTPPLGEPEDQMTAEPSAQTSAPPVCATCATPLAAGQDWCLECGRAQPGRLGSRPGKRAAATLLSLTMLLTGGAVAASYAALNHDDAVPAAGDQLAQAPAAAAPAPAAPAPAAPAPSPPATAASTAPSAQALKAATPPPVVSAPPPIPSAPSSGTATPVPEGSAKTEPKTKTTTSDGSPAASEGTPIDLADGAVALYDPYARSVTSPPADPARATDGDPNTSLPIAVAPGSTQIDAGVTIDLGSARGVRELDLIAKTPGFRVEIYATDSAELPPNVLDTRWAHLKDVGSVGDAPDAHGWESVKLSAGTTKYRHLLLWLTTPPTDGTTVRVAELKVLG